MKMRSPLRYEPWADAALPDEESGAERLAVERQLFAQSGVRRLKTLRALSETQISDIVAQMLQDCPGTEWPDGFHVPLAPLTMLVTRTGLPKSAAALPGATELPPVWGTAETEGLPERLRLLADALVPGPPDLRFEDRLALAGLLDLAHLPDEALGWAASVTIRHLRPEMILLFNLDTRTADKVTSALADACPVLASAWPEALDLWVEPAGQLEGWSLRGKGGPSVAVIPSLPLAPEDMADTRFWYWEVCTLVASDIRRAFNT